MQTIASQGRNIYIYIYIYIYLCLRGCLLQSEFVSDGSLKSIAARGGGCC